MANLLGQNIGTNYKGILNLDTINTPLDATLRAVTDGEGNASGLKLSTTDSSFSGNVGIGTDAPISVLQVSIPTTGTILTLNNSATPAQIFKISKPFSALNLFDMGTTATNFKIFDSYIRISVGSATTNFSILNNGNIGIGIGDNSPAARVDIKGSGTTASTNALLVQNNAGTSALTIKDDLSATFGGALTSSSSITTTATVQGGNINAANILYIGNYQSSIKSNGSGIIQLQNTAENDFSRLQFGGTTSSFPSLKRNGTAIDVRLADDSNYALLNTGATFIKGSGTTSATTALLVQNSAGATALQVYDHLDVRVFGGLAFNNGNTFIINISNTLQISAINGATSDLHLNPNRQVNINNTNSYTAQASAILQADSTTKGFLPPRMTTTQKNAIATPASGINSLR
jgi:hypothetical protein